MPTTYNRDTIDYFDCLLFEDKMGTYVQRDGKVYLYCGDMKLDCGLQEKEIVTPSEAGDNLVYTTSPNPNYGKDMKDNGVFVVVREGTSYGLVFRGSVVRPIKFGEM